MKRKLKWLAIVLAVALLGFGTASLLWPRDRITAESWQKIRIGMTEKEVEGVLGEPGLNWVQVHEAELEYLETFGKVPRGTGLFFWEPENLVGFHPEAMKTWKSKHGCIEATLFGKATTNCSDCSPSTQLCLTASAIGLAGEGGRFRP